jgi:hypothetical protein
MSLKRFTTAATSLLLAILVAVLILTPAIPVRASVTDFNGPSLPADWFVTAWTPGGAVTNTNGTLAVDGALTGTIALYGPGLVLEFVATFTDDPWQHMGFGLDYTAAPWINFSRYTALVLQPWAACAQTPCRAPCRTAASRAQKRS